MKRFLFPILSLAVALAFVASAGTQDPAPAPVVADIKIDAEYKIEPGEFLVIEPQTKGKRVLWRPLDDASTLSILPPAKSVNPNAMILVAKAPGRYRWLAITSINDEPVVAETVVVVWSPSPPAPPPPPDLMRPALQKAYDSDPSPLVARRAFVVSLAGFYEAAADYAQLANLQTTTALLEKLRSERPKFCPDNALIEVRKVIAAEQLATFGRDADAMLDATVRAKAKALFSRIATALMEVK